MSLKMTSAEIRQGYIDFFVQKHGHTFVPSSPVVPHDDPTLLFTNAGMNQFKPIFLGQEKRAYSRAVNTQKCIRAGGKHNDLDDVGRSRRHHTFFEMLGNWSFGDYFKQGAIEMSWELLTKVWKLDPTRLHVTCYEGDEKSGIPRDTEAAEIWRKVGNWEQYGLKSDDHIHFFGAKDNFWEMGDTGPCGPCTEINVDRRPQAEIDEDRRQGKRAPVNGDDPRVMEIWNNVFIQYNRNPDRTLTVLPAQHVDTGMGFERVTQVIQGVDSNYEIDLFHPFWAKLKELSGFTYGGKYPPTNAADPVAEAADASLRHDIAFRVIADHIRCLTFSLTDGATPSNEGRGYVLRRILRRAVRFGRQQLELKDPFLYKLVDVVVAVMGDAFPELKKNPARVIELVKEEEISFGKTLDRGIALSQSAAVYAAMNEIRTFLAKKYPGEHFAVGCSVGGRFISFERQESEMDDYRKEGILYLHEDSKIFVQRGGDQGEVLLEVSAIDWNASDLKSVTLKAPKISAADAFKLHDTYGFPIDLTRIMAEERGLSVDVEGYEKLMEEAKEKARSARDSGVDIGVRHIPPAALDALARTYSHSRTDDSFKFGTTPLDASVAALWTGVNFSSHEQAGYRNGECAVILDRTNFYSEMGGQVGDQGVLGAPGTSFTVITTRNIGGVVLHIGQLTHGAIKPGTRLTATVDPVRRSATQQNHTTTHLANWALREIFGDDIQQKGSLVDPEKLRFDFSHGKALELSEIEKVESLVNAAIAKKLPVYAEEAPQEQALKIAGLRAVFGEKYPPMVRVVSIGAPVKDLLADPANEKWRQFSIEFCGGTHLKSSADAEAFVITEESSVSKGVRRIVALTGMAASAAMKLSTEVDAAIKSGDLPALQKLVPTPNIPLLAKRRAQAAILDLQAKLKAAEKAAKSAGSGVDAVAIASELLAAAPTFGPGKLVVGAIPGASDDQLRGALDSLRKKQPSLALMLGATDGERVSFLAAVSDDLIALGLKSGDWIRETAKIAGGGGGGRPQMAQAGGKDPSKLQDALAKATEFALATVK